MPNARSKLKLALNFAVLAAVWVACPFIGWWIAWFADSRHDVEWAILSQLLVWAGMLIGPFIGYGAVRLLFRDRTNSMRRSTPPSIWIAVTAAMVVLIAARSLDAKWQQFTFGVSVGIMLTTAAFLFGLLRRKRTPREAASHDLEAGS